jgi:endonuclease/exonuclease/phosphatase (EEP) superfamily protein YafD
VLAQAQLLYQFGFMVMRHTVFCVLSALITAVLLLVSLRYVTGFWLLSFVYSFQVHLGLACAAGSVVALLVKRHWYGFLMLALATFLNIHGFVMLREFAGKPVPDDAPALFRLMSFNVEINNAGNEGRIADAILVSGADVVDIMEAEPIARELPRLQQIYPYRIGCDTPGECDTLVLSKRPFLSQGVADLGSLWKRRLTSAEIDFGGNRIQFLFPHLSKPYFDRFQVEELKDLRNAVWSSQGPLVVAGDFNSAIIAPGIQHFLRETGLKTVFPEPATWPIRAGVFGISIDHVLARSPLLLKSTSRLDDNFGSNHFGLVADFVLDG